MGLIYLSIRPYLRFSILLILESTRLKRRKRRMSIVMLSSLTHSKLFDSIYMYHGVEDQVVPYYDAVNTAKAWCKQGATINFASESGLGVGHYLTMIELAQPGLRWLSLRMQGIRPPAGCQWDTDFFGMYVNNTGVPTPPVNAMLKGF